MIGHVQDRIRHYMISNPARRAFREGNLCQLPISVREFELRSAVMEERWPKFAPMIWRQYHSQLCGKNLIGVIGSLSTRSYLAAPTRRAKTIETSRAWRHSWPTSHTAFQQ